MKTIVITGATSGFGRLMTEEILKAGNRVIATGRNLKSRKEIFAETRKAEGDRLVEHNLDISNQAEIEGFAKFLNEQKVEVDVLINNAGYGLFGALEDLSIEQVRAQVEVNFFGGVLLTKALLPLLRKKKGRIINFSSILGFVGFPLTSLYCASKYAVGGFSEALAHELKPHGIQVCLVEPGSFRTGFRDRVQWGDEILESNGGIYSKQTENYHKLVQRLAARPNPSDPRRVAREVVRLVNLQKMPRRIRMGNDSRMTGFMRKALPESVFLKVMGSVFNKTFDEGVST